MIPTFLVVGLIGGILGFRRARLLVFGIIVASVLVTIGFAIWGELNDVGDALVALGFTAANLVVGAAVGYGFALAFQRGRRSVR